MLSRDQKYLHDLWRPVVAVREHDSSCGPAGPETNNDLPEDADPFWQPLGCTEAQHTEQAVRPRHRREFEDGLWQMIIENSLSRIDLGIHWSFDSFRIRPNGSLNLARNIGGVPLGLKVAEDIFASEMKKSPVGSRT